MHRLDEDRLLANAARYLFDGGQEDAGRLLLSCTLEMDYREGVMGSEWYDVSLVCPRAIFDLLQDQNHPTSQAILHALSVVVPRGSGMFPNKIDVKAGYKDRDEQSQAAMLQIAHGSDAPIQVVEAGSARQHTKRLLVTPIPVFPLPAQKQDKLLCFILMPFAPAFQDVYDRAIKSAVAAAGLHCQRADDIMKPGSILGQLWTALTQARVVIADLSTANGNVLYELDLAHVLGHEAILLTQDMSIVPFDLVSQRHIIYSPTTEGLGNLSRDLETMLRAKLDDDMSYEASSVEI